VKLTERNKIQQVWVLGHVEIDGNEEMRELMNWPDKAPHIP